MGDVLHAHSIYGVHPGVYSMQSWVESLPQKTGRSLDEWIEFTRSAGPVEEKERRKWLKEECALGTSASWWIAELAEGRGYEDFDPEAYLRNAPAVVDTMFSGAKEALRPIYERLLELGSELGDDVKACPCKTIVPLYRNHVFAEIKPSTRTRIDFGLALRDTPATERLIDTGGFAKKDRITHRFALTSIDQIDDEVRQWLQIAYDMDRS